MDSIPPTSPPSSPTSSPSVSPQPPPAEVPITELLEQDITLLSPEQLEAFAARLASLQNHVVLHAALRGKKTKTKSSDEGPAGRDRLEAQVDALEKSMEDLFSQNT